MRSLSKYGWRRVVGIRKETEREIARILLEYATADYLSASISKSGKLDVCVCHSSMTPWKEREKALKRERTEKRRKCRQYYKL